MVQHLYTGAWTLNSEADGRHHGATLAFGALEEEGVVQIHLKGRKIPWDPERVVLQRHTIEWQQEGDDIIIELPERLAYRLSELLSKVTVQLEHLRGLSRHGLLAPEAMYDRQPGSQEDTA